MKYNVKLAFQKLKINNVRVESEGTLDQDGNTKGSVLNKGRLHSGHIFGRKLRERCNFGKDFAGRKLTG